MTAKNSTLNAFANYRPSLNAGWVGFDLDGTLARHNPRDGVDKIGEPIPRMVQRLKMYIEQGIRCKIFTARADDLEAAEWLIQPWLQALGLPMLEVTNKKDYLMLYCYDDRARQVIPNTGVVVGE